MLYDVLWNSNFVYILKIIQGGLRMKNFSIKKKLYFMILVIFIPMIIHQVYEINVLFERSIETELKSNEDFADAVGVSFTNYLERLWDTELAMGISILKSSTESIDELGAYMKEIASNQPTISEYRWVDPGTVKITASSAPDAIGVSLEGRDYINRILEGEEKVVSNMLISRVDNRPTFTVARGIRKDGILKGIIVATINVEKLHLVMPSNRSTGYSFFGLMDAEGVFVYRNGVPDVASKMINMKYNPNVAPALAGEIVRVKKFLSAITGKQMIGVNEPIWKIGWVTFANTSYDEVLSRTFKDLRVDMYILFCIITAGSILSIIIGREIIQPINILKSSAVKMSNGSLDVRTNITGSDEIALAAQAFDQMAESIEEYDALKTQFFSNLSHELKTPLNIILASVQMIGSKHPAPCRCETYGYVEKYISMMRKNCYRLLRLINNLIDITRIDSGFLKFNFDNYNIVSIIEDITLSVVDFSESKGISVVFDTDIEEKIIACDPDKIERIMLNLLSNSIKFTPTGGNILVEVFDKENNILIKVTDTGIGIPEDKQSIIFERFRQVDSSMQREQEGSGIGLSLVKALVAAHSGDIYVQSKSGQGTEVTIELPVRTVAEKNAKVVKTYDSQGMDKVQRINIEFSDIYS
jgi:signal transduction histidine kinase